MSRLAVISLAFADPIAGYSNQCTLSAGYICWSEDLSHSPVSSAQACCDLCSTTAGCTTFTYDQYNIYGDAQPTCFLKTGCSDKRASSSAVSGISYNPSPAPAPSPGPGDHCELSEGYNCWSEDIGNFPGYSAEYCCDLCSATSGCKGFTYDTYDVNGVANPTCFLKAGCADKRPSGTAVAGTMGSGPAPNPTPAPTPLLPDGVSVRVAKALGSRGYDKLRVSLIRKSSAQTQPEISQDGVVWSYDSQFQHRWTDNHIRSAIVTVEPGQRQTLNLDGNTVQVRIPKEGEGTVGFLIADPCIVYSSWCPFVHTFDIKQTLYTVMDSLAKHDELDYWINAGDLFYDQVGETTWDFFSGLSPAVASTVHGISMGNHDFWQDGSPNTASMETDNFGQGIMQWYAQDTMSSKYDESFLFDQSRLPPQTPHVSNFFSYYMMGNVAFISFSGEHGWDDSEDYFAEACKWADSNNPSLLVLLGHWDADNLGCSSGMATPEIYSKLLQMPGCQRFGSRIKFFEGHNHCNHIVSSNTGFMIGSFGMSGCGDFGLPIMDTRHEQAVLYYFKLGQGGARVNNWDSIMNCIKSYGLSGCTQYAEKWMEQSLTSMEQI